MTIDLEKRVEMLEAEIKELSELVLTMSGSLTASIKHEEVHDAFVKNILELFEQTNEAISILGEAIKTKADLKPVMEAFDMFNTNFTVIMSAIEQIAPDIVNRTSYGNIEGNC